MNEQEAIISLNSVYFSYGKEPVLEDVSLNIYPGDFVAFVGPNGGGKTTLLKIITGLLTPQRGTIRIHGVKQHRGCQKIGYVAQLPPVDRNFPLTVLEAVLMGLLPERKIGQRYTKADRRKALQILDKVGMADYAHHPVGSLSGGQQQRVFIARALVGNPEVLIMDEPTANVDTCMQKDIYTLLSEVQREKITIILVSHDIAAVLQYAGKIIGLNRRVFHHARKDLDLKSLQDIFCCSEHGH